MIDLTQPRQKGITMSERSAGRRQTARKAASSEPKEKPVDPQLQQLIDIENANIQLIQQSALIEHLKGRVVSLHQENLELKKQAGKKNS
jgi:hypothetical protein